MDTRDSFWLLVSLAVAGIAAVWGGFYAEQTGSVWFAAMEMPPLFPPNLALHIGWSLAFLVMGYASWLVGMEASFENRGQIWTAYSVYGLQLLMFVAWCYVFFFEQRFGWAALVLGLFWSASVLTSWAFFRIRRLAGGLFAAALLWVSFNLYLGFGIAAHHSTFLGDVLTRLLG